MKTINQSSISLSMDSQGKSTDALHPISTELQIKKDDLGWIDKLILDRRIKRDVKRALADCYLQYVEAKRQEVITKITLGLDEAKQRALVESMKTSEELGREIGNLSAEFAFAMMDGVHARYIAAAKAEATKLHEIEDLNTRGEIPAHRYPKLKESAQEATDDLISIVKGVARKIIEGHVHKINIALEVFKERQMTKLI